MREGRTTVTRRVDYTPPAYWIDTVDLTLDLAPAKTRVLNRMRLRRNPDVPAQPLRLDGDELDLSRVRLNGAGCSFRLDGDTLVIDGTPEDNEPFELEVFNTCAPEKNSKLMGLFMSGGDFFTQCESEGFRRITYFLDRPDVMATYTVTLRADKARWPVLLSNGNLIEEGDLDDGRHYAKWHDPHKKPCYLFAVVAGRLVAREQRITSRDGQPHLLQMHVRPGDLDQTEHAMNSLMHAVAWDEARFGRHLDLERFAVVATSDFNFGAMENKGLNVFNTKYVLAKPSTATDTDYENIEGVIGHEYFHNWSGNRVTCRDWFQLSLKEGLTVFRDQEFSMDMAGSASARAVRRIRDVNALRTVQFAEDASPMAHPVRPDEYLEVTNFYTTTVYEKGAEVVRMVQTLLGRDGFRKGTDLYFQRHDGQAVTCDDFAQAMADANPDSLLAQELEQFKRWYSQSGTPVVRAEGHYDPDTQTYTLKLTQSCPPTPGQPRKQPFVIPVRLGLVGADGRDLPLQAADASALDGDVVVLSEPELTLCFTGMASEPVPSLLRGFSAPVKLRMDTSRQQLLHLLAHDADPFNRWEAGQQLALRAALAQVASDAHPVSEQPLDAAHVQALRALLHDAGLDPAFKALALTPPSQGYIAEQMDVIDPQRIHAMHEAMQQQLARELAEDWQAVWQQCHDTGAYSPDPLSSGKRALAGLALHMLCRNAVSQGAPVWPGKAYQRVKDAGNMTDRINALSALLACHHELAAKALAHFHALYHDEALALDKWFTLQGSAPDRNGSALAAVKKLMAHPDFTLRNPNRARSLIFAYCQENPGGFHRRDAAGYVYWAEQVAALDAINPQVAARLARAMDAWARLAEPWRNAARQALERVAARPSLSDDVREVVGRMLASEVQAPAQGAGGAEEAQA